MTLRACYRATCDAPRSQVRRVRHVAAREDERGSRTAERAGLDLPAVARVGSYAGRRAYAVPLSGVSGASRLAAEARRRSIWHTRAGDAGDAGNAGNAGEVGFALESCPSGRFRGSTVDLEAVD